MPVALNVSIIGALLPVFAVVLAGYGFRRFHFPGDAFWPYAERFTYFVLFPCLLLQKTATASLMPHVVAPMALALLAAFLMMAGVLLFMRLFWSAGGPAFTSFFQGGIRFNTYVGLSAAYALFGNEGLTLAAVAIAVLIPLVNLLCVTVLIFSVKTNGRSWRALFAAIIQNPIIIACSTGIMLNVAGIGLPPTLDETAKLFGGASLPLGLLAVGAGIHRAGPRMARGMVMANSALKLLGMPLVVWAVCRAFEVEATQTAIAVLFGALPGSPLSYILARQLGGDSSLMANLVATQTVLSMVTLPLVMAVFVS
jgi:predicted permease